MHPEFRRGLEEALRICDATPTGHCFTAAAQLRNKLLADTLSRLPRETIAALHDWVDQSSKVGGWIDGYGLGRAYTDTRTRGGQGYAQRRAYVKRDEEVSKLVPDLIGTRWEMMQSALAELAQTQT